MKNNKDGCFVPGPQPIRRDMSVTPQEDIVTGVYYLVDETTTHHIDRLRDEEGLIPACKRECCRCCQFHIPMNVAEAQALAQYIKRSLSLDHIDEPHLPTLPWDEWEAFQPGRLPLPPAGGAKPLQTEKPIDCPLLADNACMAYPTMCRTHFVSSHSFSCWAINDPHAA